MAKKKPEILNNENVVFDSYEFTLSEYEKCSRKMTRLKVAMIIAAAAIVCLLAAMIADSEILWYLSVAVSVAAYLVGGVLWSVIRLMFKAASFAWYIVPILLLDIAVAGAVFLILLGVFFILPIAPIPVAINYFRVRSTCREAEKALHYFKPAWDANGTDGIAENGAV